jgi:hypothetical protein
MQCVLTPHSRGSLGLKIRPSEHKHKPHGIRFTMFSNAKGGFAFLKSWMPKAIVACNLEKAKSYMVLYDLTVRYDGRTFGVENGLDRLSAVHISNLVAAMCPTWHKAIKVASVEFL